MNHDAKIAGPIARFAGARLSAPPSAIQIAARPLQGGLVSRSVQWIVARGPDNGGCRFVAKQLEGTERREARVHLALMASPVRSLAPSLLGLHDRGEGPSWLFLEALSPVHPWPWQDVEHVGDVLRALASLHQLSRASVAASLAGWDYEQELTGAGARLVDLLVCHNVELKALGLGNCAWFVRGFVERLAAARHRMLGQPEVPASLIHGDVHSGNVVLCARARGGGIRPVFLDWGRARIGSPLEDVSSWLQSLGFWEPRARRQHDTLLRIYLRARGLA